MKLWQPLPKPQCLASPQRPAVYKIWQLLESAPRTPAELIRSAESIGVKPDEARDVLARLEGDVLSYEEGQWRCAMKKTLEIRNINEFVAIAKELRSNAEEAEARFLLFLREFEVKREDLWRTDGVVSFDACSSG